jgi:hypothetical protein
MEQPAFDENSFDYYVDEQSASLSDIKEAPFTVVCEDVPLRCAVHTFQSRESYLMFAGQGCRSRHLATSIGNEEILRTTKLLYDSSSTPPNNMRSRIFEKEIARLAKDSGKPLGFDLWNRAAKGSSILEGPLLGSIVLHENRNMSGGFVYVPHWWGSADFGFMNNRASCITLAGSFATLWAGPWFSGRKLDIITFPLWVGFPLWWVGWEDIASSVYAWGSW